MKINQIQLPDTPDKMMLFLDGLDEDDVYLVYRLSPGVAEKYKVSCPLNFRPFDSIWSDAVERGRTESLVRDLFEGCVALVRVE